MKALKKTSAAGFTIVEVTAALGVFGVVAAGLAANTLAVVRNNRVSSALSVATALAQDEIEQLRALDPSSAPPELVAGSHSDDKNPLTALGASGGTFTRQWTVTRDAPAPGLSTVVVSVSWTDGATRSVHLTAYVCQTATCG